MEENRPPLGERDVGGIERYRLVSEVGQAQIADDLRLPASFAANAGIDQSLTGSLRVSATYTYRRSATLLRGRNTNAPVGGVRPDPRFGNVVEVVNDAGSRTHQLGATVSFLNSDAWGTWQRVHTPSLKGKWSTFPPALRAAPSWQLTQSASALPSVSNGFGAEGGV